MRVRMGAGGVGLSLSGMASLGGCLSLRWCTALCGVLYEFEGKEAAASYYNYHGRLTPHAAASSLGNGQAYKYG